MLCDCLKDNKGDITRCKGLYNAIGNARFDECMKNKFPKVPK